MWKKRYFLVCTTFHGRGQIMDGTKKGTLFLGQKPPFFARKSVVLPFDPNFCNSPLVALGETVHFAPLERFFDFLFPSYGCFRKKSGRRAKKSSPTPLWGHRLPETALALSHLFTLCRTILGRKYHRISMVGFDESLHATPPFW